MASSTSLEGELNLLSRQQVQHKVACRSRQQRTHRSKNEQHSQPRERTVSSTITPSPLQSFELNNIDKGLKSPSNKGNRHHKRNLREKRRPTGVVHILSTESTGATSSESEETLDDDTTAKRNAHFNEIFLASNGVKEKEESREELKSANDKLKEQLKIKEDYIKKLEQRLEQLELQKSS